MSPNIPSMFAALVIAVCVSGCSHEPTAADKTPEGVEVAITEAYRTVRNGPVTKEDWEHYCVELITTDSRPMVPICENPHDDSGAARDEIIRITKIQVDGDHASADVDVVQHLYPGGFTTWHEELEYEEGRWKRVATSQY